MNMPPPPVIASFFDRRSRRLSIHPVRVPSGLVPYTTKAREACRRHAVEHSYTHFAVPHPLGGWHVLELVLFSTTKPVHEAPTREAAEMWMVHLG